MGNVKQRKNKMLKKIDWVEFGFVLGGLIFAIAICYYHISFDGYLNLSNEVWGSIWAISENGLSLLMSLALVIFAYGALKKFFGILLIYFSVKLIYHFSCYSKIYICSKEIWEQIWSYLCVGLFVIGLLYFIYIIQKNCHTH